MERLEHILSRLINSSIDGLAMPDQDHDDEQLPVPDRVDDSIPAHSYTIPIVLSSELFATRRPRIIGRRTDAGRDALTVLFGGQRPRSPWPRTA
jgi:hypothetical protein